MVADQHEAIEVVENIRVAVRLRPFTRFEVQGQAKRIVDIEQNTVALYHPKSLSQVKKFTFDYSYWSYDGFKRDSSGLNVPDSSHPNHDKYVDQDKVFQDLGKFLLHNSIKGYNSALLAYGQTGSGKSYTVSGYGQNEGILPRFARELFDELEAEMGSTSPTNGIFDNDDKLSSSAAGQDNSKKALPSSRLYKYEIYFSMLEIYNEVVRDLLAKNHGHTVPATVPRRGLKVREHPQHGFFAEGLTSIRCQDRKEIETRIEEGQLNKSIAATSMNETSSRGHTIYKFTIKQIKIEPSSKEETMTTSIVQLVDLAGSERTSILTSSSPGADSARQAKRSTQRFRESVSINQSLSALGNCIQILSQNSQLNNQAATHGELQNTGNFRKKKVPYRDSVLTKLLNNCCLSGNSKTVIIATVSPADINYDDTLSTLRFADRAKQIRTHAHINETNEAQVLNSLRKENERLKEMVDRRSHRSDDSSQTSNFDESESVVENFTGSHIGQLYSSQHRAPNNKQRASTRRMNRADNLATATANRQHDYNIKKLVSSASNKIITTAAPAALSKSNNNKRQILSKTVSLQSTKSISLKGKRPSTPPPGESSSNSHLQNRRISRDIEIEDEDEDMVNPSEDDIAGEQEDPNAEEEDQTAEEEGLDNIEVEGDIPFDENDQDDYEIRDDDEPTNSNGELQITSPSDDSMMNGLIEDDLSEIDRIDLVNKTNSNASQPIDQVTSSCLSPTDNNQSGANLRQNFSRSAGHKSSQAAKQTLSRSIRRVSLIATELKRDHPHLSNLNPDEQLSGKLSYIIKPGITTIGKDDSCDIVLHGLDIRASHARIVYETSTLSASFTSNSKKSTTKTIYIEPMLYSIGGGVEEQEEKKEKETEREEKVEQLDKTKQTANHESPSNNKLAPIMVNGSPVRHRTELYNCDRLLFGTNVYFVFINNDQSPPLLDENTTPANKGKDETKPLELDSITYDMAKAEVLKNVMMNDGLNSSIVRDLIQGKDNSTNHIIDGGGRPRSYKKDTQDANTIDQINDNEHTTNDANYDDEYSERIRLDTAELAWQLEEVNKIAEEMDIKLHYELCVLTGAEQLIAPIEGPSWYEFDKMNNKSSHSSSQSSSKSSSVLNGMMDTSRASSSIQSDSRSNMINDNSNEDNNSIRTLTNASLSASGVSRTIADLNKVDASTIPAAVYVRVRSVDLDMDFFWSKDKFIDRRFKIQDLYGVYSFDNGGKQALISYLIEQSNHQTIIDPFFDDPRTTYVLIGHVQLILQPLSHLVDIDQEYDIVSVDDQILGTISVQAIPCHENNDKHYPFTPKELEDSILDDPEELIGRKLAFMLKINSCGQIPEKYTSIYCQYMLHLDSNVVRTDFVSVRQPETQEIIFNHVHYITFEEISQDSLNILRYGTMTIQVVGRYNYNETNNKPISTVFSIVNSINKHRAKLTRQQQQQHQSGFMDHQLMRGGRGPMSMTSKSGASSTASSAMMTMDDNQQGDDDVDDGGSQPQEDIIDVILTKRKLDRAENQLHYLKRTVNIAEHYNKKHIPVKTVKKLLSSYGHDLNTTSLDEIADVSVKKRSQNDSKTCTIS